MKILRHTKLLILLVAGLAMFVVQSCEDVKIDQQRSLVSDFDSNVYLRWNALFLELDRYAVGYRPGPVPHALGYMGYAAYEAVVPGMLRHNSLENQFPGLQIPNFNENLEYHWPTVVNEVYAYLMTRFFFYMENEYADLFQKIETTRTVLNDEFAAQIEPDILERSRERGRQVAAAVYEWEKTDVAAHNAFLTPQPNYNAPDGPGYWAPTVPDFVKAMFPFWGQVRTFALPEDDQLAYPPIPYSENPNSLFYKQAEEAYARVKNIRDNGPNAYEERWLAEFWSDDILGLTFSPPARLIAVANQIVEIEGINLEESAELYAKLGMALNDISVGIWQSKYVYNVERPVSYIRRVLVLEYPDAADWLPILNNPVTGYVGVTPAFPAYPSGHAGFGAAGAKILSSFFEYNVKHPGTYSFVDRCHENRTEFLGYPRVVSSFNDLSNQNAESRIPLGVHFRMDRDEGIRMGEVAAQHILELPWKR